MATTTRERIVTLRDNHPNLPAVRIAEFLSVSRERVRQILKAEGLPTRVRPDYGECKVCGGELEVDCAGVCGGDAMLINLCEDTDGDGLGNPGTEIEAVSYTHLTLPTNREV